MDDVCLLNRSAVELFKKSITNTQLFQSLIRQDVRLVANRAIPALTRSDMRGFIYRCFTGDQDNAGLMVVNEVISHALATSDQAGHQQAIELLEAAIGTLSVLSANNRQANNKLFELMRHDNPAIVKLTINNLGRSTNVKTLETMCGLLLHPGAEVRHTAVRFIEACTRDAAFRRPVHASKIEDSSEDFLRRILVPLERAYRQLAVEPLGKNNVQKRIAILIALIYNEILDSTDWKRRNKEDVDERIYLTLEQHLHDEIGPAAIPNLMKMILRADLEDGMKQSALNTLGRMSNYEPHRAKIAAWVKQFRSVETSHQLLHTAQKLSDAIEKQRPFSSIPAAPIVDEDSAIIPRKAGAPLKSNR